MMAIREHPDSSLRTRLPAVLVMVAMIVSSLSSAVAQFDVRLAIDNRMVNIGENQIEQAIFRNSRSRTGQGLEQAINRLELQLDLVELIGDVSDEQRETLELAGWGDIQRFFDRVELLKRSTPTGQVPMEEYQQLWQKVRPLHARFNKGLHGPGSLFRKTLRTTLTEEQGERFEQLERDRHRRHYDAIVRAAVASIEGAIPLTSRQRTQLIELITEKTDPPESYGQSYNQFRVIIWKMSQIPEEELKPIFLENEWKVMQALLQQGRFVEQQIQQLDELEDEDW
jgi:hypothetical protein